MDKEKYLLEKLGFDSATLGDYFDNVIIIAVKKEQGGSGRYVASHGCDYAILGAVYTWLQEQKSLLKIDPSLDEDV